MATWGKILTELQDAQRRGDRSPLDTVRRRYLSDLAAHTGRCTILYASAWDKEGPPNLVTITPEDVEGFMEVVHGLDPEKGLDVVLHLPGGSAEATEALVNYIRTKFDNVRAIVPHAAMSAATMFACATDEIVMGKHSSLGPIDPQFILRTESGVKSVAAHAIVEQFRMAQSECSDPKKLPSWLPILRQYGPALIVQCQLAQKLSTSLVSTWLAKYMLEGEEDVDVKAAHIANSLSDHAKFMSHGRFIPIQSARELGLKVVDLERDQKLQDLVLGLYHATSHTFAATPAVKVIENNEGKGLIRVHQVVA